MGPSLWGEGSVLLAFFSNNSLFLSFPDTLPHSGGSMQIKSGSTAGPSTLEDWRVITKMADDIKEEIIICPKVELLKEIETNIVCSVAGCSKILPNSSSLRMHLVKTHNVITDLKENKMFERDKNKNKTKTLYCCPVDGCVRGRSSGRPFSRLAHVKQHYMTIHGEKKYTCKVCDKKFGRNDACLRHEKECGKVFPCSCGCPFNSRTSMLNHAKRNGHAVPNAAEIKGTSPTTINSHKNSTCSPTLTQGSQLCFPILPITNKGLTALRPLMPKQSLSNNAETQTEVPCICMKNISKQLVKNDKSYPVDITLPRSTALTATCEYTQTMDNAFTQSTQTIDTGYSQIIEKAHVRLVDEAYTQTIGEPNLQTVDEAYTQAIGAQTVGAQTMDKAYSQTIDKVYTQTMQDEAYTQTQLMMDEAFTQTIGAQTMDEAFTQTIGAQAMGEAYTQTQMMDEAFTQTVGAHIMDEAFTQTIGAQTMDEAYTQTSFIADPHFDMDFTIDNEEFKELAHSQTQTNWGIAFDGFPLFEDNETQTLESYLEIDPSNITLDCATQTKTIFDIFSVDTQTQTLLPLINLTEEQFEHHCNPVISHHTQTS